MEAQNVALPVPLTAIAGAPSFDLSEYYRVTFQVTGITSSSVNLEGTLDGTSWAALKTGLANGIFTLDGYIGSMGAVKYVRAHTVSISGGETPAIRMLAQNLGY